MLLSSLQTKTYDSVTDKFMDFSFEKVFLFQTHYMIIFMLP